MVWICCGLICVGAYRWGDMKWENAKYVAIEYWYTGVSHFMTPYIYTYEERAVDLIYVDIESFFVPIASEFRNKKYESQNIEKEETDTSIEIEVGVLETESEIYEPYVEPPKAEQSVAVSGQLASVETEKKVIINRTKLQDFDYLRQNFYQIDNTTTIGSDLLNADLLLGMDMTLTESVDGPQILIYHTHSQEGYVDSIPGDSSTTVVGVGDYLEQLLEEKYGILVLHHEGVYDLPSRDSAYSAALPNIEKVLQENPTIEVVIDLHRDGVAEGNHLVTEMNGKATAKLMFFNGLSRTTSQGELTYLENSYLKENLALSLQMQLAAEEYYPGLMRKIYLKGYRYNMHLKPKSMLVEVGAQTNTFEEAKNAMEPLADILAMVLVENDSTNEEN